RHDGSSPGESAIGFNVLIAGDVGDHADDEKRAQIHNEVNHHVKKNRREPVIVEHREAHEHIASMSNARIGEHAFEISLVQSAEIADGHSEHADEQKHMAPLHARYAGPIAAPHTAS